MTKPPTASPSPRTLEELSQTPEGRRALAFSMAAPIRGAGPRVTPAPVAAPPPEEVERAAEDEGEGGP